MAQPVFRAKSTITAHRTGTIGSVSESAQKTDRTGTDTGAFRAPITTGMHRYGTVPRAFRARAVIQTRLTGTEQNAFRDVQKPSYVWTVICASLATTMIQQFRSGTDKSTRKRTLIILCIRLDMVKTIRYTKRNQLAPNVPHAANIIRARRTGL